MKKYTKQDLLKVLKKSGIKQGDTVLMHSRLFSLGVLEEDAVSNIPKVIAESFSEVLGSKGTLAVPTFFYEYARKSRPFYIDSRLVSKEMGKIAEYVLNLKGTVRSINPVFNISANGFKAKYICRGKNASAFGKDSAWDRLSELNAKMIFLGVSPTEAMTYVHYIEHRYGVPHAYHKYYITPVYKNDKEQDFKISAFVRYLDYDVKYALGAFVNRLESKNLLRRCEVGMGNIYCISMRDCLEEGTRALSENIFCFLETIPKFRKDNYPLK